MTDSANISFRSVIPTQEHPGVADVWKDYPEWPSLDKYSWFKRQSQNPGLAKLMEMWRESVAQPFYGVTTDGKIQPGMFGIADDSEARAAPTREAMNAADHLLSLLNDEQRKVILHALDSDVWRMWANPEFYANQYGLRMDETSLEVREALLSLLRASMSQRGFEKAQGCMLTNAFLGTLVGGESIMNEFSYNLNIFGAPSLEDPWGFNFYGHHLCLNICFVGPRMVISPTFMGAEPDYIDEGEHEGLRIFRDEEMAGLKLMQSLNEEHRKKAQLYENMHGDHLPSERWNPFDERHVAGAFRDNRVIPYEGVCLKDFSEDERARALACVRYFIEYLPEGPLEAKMEDIERYMDETYFVWFGGYRDEDPYYYRIHSPVIIAEFDFHCGIFLTNNKPAKFHIHTVVRTPNGNDYAKEFIRQYREHNRSGDAGEGR